MAEDVRLTGEQAGLVHVGYGGSACWKCEFWHTNDSCDLVKGRITGDLCCDGYERRGSKTKNDFKFASGEVFLPAVRAARVASLRSE